MAIGIDALEALGLLKSAGVEFGHVVTLGHQQFEIRIENLANRRSLKEYSEVVSQVRESGHGYAEPLFYEFGAQSLESIDYDDYEGCTLTHDLNEPIPKEWCQRADIVFDGGTLEHVFNFPVAIANAMNLVKKGGFFVTCTPCNNYPGHGFYQFSPELFFRLFNDANGFQVNLMVLAEAKPKGRLYGVKDPAELGHRISFSGQGALQLIMIARRKSIAEILKESPSQSDYSHTWQSAQSPHEQNRNQTNLLSRRIKSLIRNGLPTAWLYRYDNFLIEKRRTEESYKGINEIDSLSDGFSLFSFSSTEL